MKADIIVKFKDDKCHIIEIIDDDLAHYTQTETENNEIKKHVELRKRGRIAEKIALDNGFSGYSCLSYIELEYAMDENENFDNLLKRLQQLKV